MTTMLIGKNNGLAMQEERKTELRKIATIMAVYHGDTPAHFQKAITSIFDQALPENIISRLYLAVDGEIGPDLAAEILRYEPRIYKLVTIETNAGLANALNQLIKTLEDEEFVFRMDADDISMSNRYAKQIEFLDHSPEIDILGTDLIEMIEGEAALRQVSFCAGPKDALNNIGWRVPVAHPTVCFRRNVLSYVGGYPLVEGNEDIAMWFECAKKGFNFNNIHEPLLQFRVSKDFWKRRGLTKAFREWKVYIKGAFSLNGLSLATGRSMFLCSARFALRLSPIWVSKAAYRTKIRRLGDKK